jgi:membrane protein implicated in regulation of membrane protease activity
VIWFFIAIAVTLFLLDIWVATEFLSHVALLILAGVVANQVPWFGWEWRVVVFICSYLLTIAFYYLFWKQIAHRFMNDFIAPTRHVPSQEKVIGKSGVIVITAGKSGVSVDGMLWPVGPGDYEDGRPVVITAVIDGVLSVEPSDDPAT